MPTHIDPRVFDMPNATPPATSVLPVPQSSTFDSFYTPLGLFQHTHGATAPQYAPTGDDPSPVGIDEARRYRARATRDRSILRRSRRSSPPSRAGPSNYGETSGSTRGSTLGKRSKREVEPEDQVDPRPSKRAAHGQALFDMPTADDLLFGFTEHSMFSVMNSTLQAPLVQDVRSSEQTANDSSTSSWQSQESLDQDFFTTAESSSALSQGWAFMEAQPHPPLKSVEEEQEEGLSLHADQQTFTVLPEYVEMSVFFSARRALLPDLETAEMTPQGWSFYAICGYHDGLRCEGGNCEQTLAAAVPLPN
ncbi:hypothetical protein OF83DRAFT_1285703 [Amylostereum chailletii]|nr:hypothetical protein OF83DRAFT_1285703 [Amylostereum chailletii]